MSFMTCAVLYTSRSCITSLWPKMTFSISELQMDMRMKRYICQQQYFSSKSGDTSQLDITGTNNVGCAKDFPFLKYSTLHPYASLLLQILQAGWQLSYVICRVKFLKKKHFKGGASLSGKLRIANVAFEENIIVKTKNSLR